MATMRSIHAPNSAFPIRATLLEHIIKIAEQLTFMIFIRPRPHQDTRYGMLAHAIFSLPADDTYARCFGFIFLGNVAYFHIQNHSWLKKVDAEGCENLWNLKHIRNLLVHHFIRLDQSVTIKEDTSVRTWLDQVYKVLHTQGQAEFPVARYKTLLEKFKSDEKETSMPASQNPATLFCKNMQQIIIESYHREAKQHRACLRALRNNLAHLGDGSDHYSLLTMKEVQEVSRQLHNDSQAKKFQETISMEINPSPLSSPSSTMRVLISPSAIPSPNPR